MCIHEVQNESLLFTVQQSSRAEEKSCLAAAGKKSATVYRKSEGGVNARTASEVGTN